MKVCYKLTRHLLLLEGGESESLGKQPCQHLILLAMDRVRVVTSVRTSIGLEEDRGGRSTALMPASSPENER